MTSTTTPTRPLAASVPNAPRKRPAVQPRSGPLIRSRRLTFEEADDPGQSPIVLGVSPDEVQQMPPYPPVTAYPLTTAFNRRIDELLGWLHEHECAAAGIPRGPARSAGSI